MKLVLLDLCLEALPSPLPGLPLPALQAAPQGDILQAVSVPPHTGSEPFVPSIQHSDFLFSCLSALTYLDLLRARSWVVFIFG
jgi:hypothetical protein